MALPVCDIEVDYVFYEWMPDGTSQGRDTLSELCVGGTREGAWCNRGATKYRIDQECTTTDIPEGALLSGQPASPQVACTASAPCEMSMSQDMRHEIDAYVTIVLVCAFVFAFFHGFGIGDSRV